MTSIIRFSFSKRSYKNLLSLLKYVLLKIFSSWSIYSWKLVLYGMITIWCLNFKFMFLLLPKKTLWKLESKLLVVMKVFQNNYFLSCGLLINVTYLYAKMQDSFFCCTFLQFWAFFLMLLPFRQEITWKFYFISNVHTWRHMLMHLKKFCHFGTELYCL